MTSETVHITASADSDRTFRITTVALRNMIEKYDALPEQDCIYGHIGCGIGLARFCLDEALGLLGE